MMRACIPRAVVLAAISRPRFALLFRRGFSVAHPSTVPSTVATTLKQEEQEPEKSAAPVVGKYKFVDPQRPEVFIETFAQLEEVMKHLQPYDILGVDTEFVSLPYYRPNLEVLQVSSPEVMIAIDVRGVMIANLQPLLELLMSKELIMHSCQSDMQILLDLATQFKMTRRTPIKVFDTQVASAFLTPKSMVAFKMLLETYFGVAIDKADTLSDWSRRPFTPNQIKYALNDVRHLHALREHLIQELTEAGRLQWCLDELAVLSNPVLFEPQNPEDAWRAIFQSKKFPSGSRELNVLRELAKWREMTGKRANLVPGFILRNETIVGLSAMMPTTRAELSNVQGIKPNTLRLHSGPILRTIEHGVETAEQNSPTHRLRHKEGGRLREGLFNLLASRVQTVAGIHNLSGDYLVPRQEVWDLASVSLDALKKVSSLGPEHFKPVKMVSHFMNLKPELLPPELSTLPRSFFNPTRKSTPEVTPTGHTILDPFTLDEEIEMLCRLKVMSGWRRELIGNDLLAIAQGNSLAWDENSGASAFSQEIANYAAVGDEAAQEKLAVRVNAWVESLNARERNLLDAVSSMAQAKLKALNKSDSEDEQPVVGEVDGIVGKLLTEAEDLIKR